MIFEGCYYLTREPWPGQTLIVMLFPNGSMALHLEAGGRWKYDNETKSFTATQGSSFQEFLSKSIDVDSSGRVTKIAGEYKEEGYPFRPAAFERFILEPMAFSGMRVNGTFEGTIKGGS